jgi:molybdopterin molybdotransferase
MTMIFDNILVVDWSGGNDRGPTPKKDAIWTALIDNGKAHAPQYFRNRDQLFIYLLALCQTKIAAGQTLLAAFDFPFGYPNGFAARITNSPDPLALWDHYAAQLIDTPRHNTRFALANDINAALPGIGPFWFNATKQTLAHLPRKGGARTNTDFAEKRVCETYAKGAFTCWQLGGAGAVGSQVITGMACLSRLRAQLSGQISVWPFEPITTPITLAEIWPSLFAAQIRAGMQPAEIKDAAQTRITAAILQDHQSAGTIQSLLDAPPDSARKTEGWILGLVP